MSSPLSFEPGRSEAEASVAPFAARRDRVVVAVALVVLWGAWIWLLRVQWSTSVEFCYGWAVPPLALYLAWLRWETRDFHAEAGSPNRPYFLLISKLAVVLGISAVGTAAWLMVPNPVWTMPMWGAGLAAVAATLGLAGLLGGAGWVRALAFPVGFVLTALPWPAVFQVPVVGALRAGNATVAAEIVSTLGYPAVATGAVVEVGRGIVGVEDACSGLRALQAVIMMGLFFGELARMSWVRRVVLVTGGIACALATNVVRTVFLTWQMARHGAESVEAWHNPAGIIELAVAVMALALLWLWLSPRPQAASAEAVADATPISWRPAVSASYTLLALAAGWSGGVFAWYRNPGTASAGVGWALRSPGADWRPYELPAVTLATLQCDVAEGLTSPSVEGRAWLALHLRWERDPALRYAVSPHSPDICLPNIGARLERMLDTVRIPIEGNTLALRAMRFTTGGRALHVFHGLWDADRARALGGSENATVDFAAERWRLVREHRRSLALEQFTIAIADCASDAEAEAQLRAGLPRLLVLRRSGG